MIFNLDVGETRVRVVAGPTAFDGRAAPAEPQGSPQMGEHTDALLTEVGYTTEQLLDLKARRVAQ
jgi:crotonobetainyl-CoA:carnitine CoA-transferase CaiB-like acyl-CoA transferase